MTLACPTPPHPTPVQPVDTTPKTSYIRKIWGYQNSTHPHRAPYQPPAKNNHDKNLCGRFQPAGIAVYFQCPLEIPLVIIPSIFGESMGILSDPPHPPPKPPNKALPFDISIASSGFIKLGHCVQQRGRLDSPNLCHIAKRWLTTVYESIGIILSKKET